MSVVERLNTHYEYAKTLIPEDRIIGLFLIGSQNYGTDIETSDVDTKLVIVPSLQDIYNNIQGGSRTYTLPDSKEQITIKDVRSVINELRKQNIGILEILFTDYEIINPIYKDIWNDLKENRESIVRYDEYTALKSAQGVAKSYYKRLIDENGKPNAKQAANLVRIETYLKHYINGAPFLECIRPEEEIRNYILQIRRGDIGEASIQYIADGSMNAINVLVDAYSKNPDLNLANNTVENLLNTCCEDFVDIALVKELAEKGVL